MSHRYYSADLITSDRARLQGDEARHLARVMRAAPGDETILFDGSGYEWTARIETITRNEVELTLLERHDTRTEPDRAVTLGIALPKGERQRWLVEKAVEVGVHCIVPLLCERSVVKPKDSAAARLERFVIEASKQSGRNRLMEIAPPVSFADFIANRPHDTLCGIAHPVENALSVKEFLATADEKDPRDVRVAIGPEGGFSEQEVAAAVEQGWKCISLGQRILRVETAALSVAILAIDR